MTDLLHKLEQATSGSRELSDEVLSALGRASDDGEHYRPSPTESLDDALQLVPEEWDWHVSLLTDWVEMRRGYLANINALAGQGDVERPHYVESIGWGVGHTKALSACIALLKALSHQNHGEEVG